MKNKTKYSREQRAYFAKMRREVQERGETFVVYGITHGRSGYVNYSCRCQICRDGNATRCRQYRESKSK